ncbi:MAG: 6,7-dimethyl-8-ribityllumazine synthase [Phycisphaerae bacterium]|jgi:6,7-dimethyl-8-ribityllumazine synthase|nr:6,7-dimethyl-8-ribityllumazine synthase [Phycisphaerae bacterium]
MLDLPTLPLSTTGLSIAIVVSRYHADITDALAEGAKQAFIDAGGNESQLIIIPVSGAWELPVIARALLEEAKVDAVIALGCIITGETTHDQVIAHAIAQGLMNLSLRYGKPVSMGVLTCQTFEQAMERAGGDCGNKGTESMNAALSTISTIQNQNET